MDNRSARPPASSAFLQRMTQGQNAGTPVSAMKTGGVQSFEQRRQMEQNRRLVKDYRQSRLGASPKMGDVRRLGAEISAASIRPSQPQVGDTHSRTRFSEPQGRNYVPYG